MRNAFSRNKLRLWMLASIVPLAAAVVFAACCIKIEWPWCDDIFVMFLPTCEEQCGDAEGFGACDKTEGYEVYVVPDPVGAESGWWDWEFSEIPALCAWVYTCKVTETECDIPGEAGDFVCATDEWDSWLETAYLYGVDDTCPEE